MGQNLTNFRSFSLHFLRYAYHVRAVLLTLMLLVVLGGVAISHLEQLHLGEAIYFAFITGLSTGYGDISPVTPWGRVVAVCIGMVGMLFTGMTIAVATRALADSIKENRADW